MAIKASLALDVNTYGDGISKQFTVDITKGPVSFRIPADGGSQMSAGFSLATFLPTDVVNVFVNSQDPSAPRATASISPLGILTIIFEIPPALGQKDTVEMDIIF